MRNGTIKALVYRSGRITSAADDVSHKRTQLKGPQTYETTVLGPDLQPKTVTIVRPAAAPIEKPMAEIRLESSRDLCVDKETSQIKIRSSKIANKTEWLSLYPTFDAAGRLLIVLDGRGGKVRHEILRLN